MGMSVTAQSAHGIQPYLNSLYRSTPIHTLIRLYPRRAYSALQRAGRQLCPRRHGQLPLSRARGLRGHELFKKSRADIMGTKKHGTPRGHHGQYAQKDSKAPDSVVKYGVSHGVGRFSFQNVMSPPRPQIVSHWAYIPQAVP
jgi:hypothetical protein